MRLRFVGSGLALVLAVGVAACSGTEDPASEAAPADVQAAAGGDHITLTNTSDTDIVYGVRDAGVVFIQPQCWAPDVCPRLAPGATAEIPFEDIVGYDASTTEVVIAIWEYIVDPETGPELRWRTEIRVKV